MFICPGFKEKVHSFNLKIKSRKTRGDNMEKNERHAYEACLSRKGSRAENNASHGPKKPKNSCLPSNQLSLNVNCPNLNHSYFPLPSWNKTQNEKKIEGQANNSASLNNPVQLTDACIRLVPSRF